MSHVSEHIVQGAADHLGILRVASSPEGVQVGLHNLGIVVQPALAQPPLAQQSLQGPL